MVPTPMYTQSLTERIALGCHMVAGCGTLFVGPLLWWADGPSWVWPCAALGWLGTAAWDETLLRRRQPRLDPDRLSSSETMRLVDSVLEPLEEVVRPGGVDGGDRRVQHPGDERHHPPHVGGGGDSPFGTIAPNSLCRRP